MYTRCPACQAVYELQARTLAEAAGVVRCGNCGKTFNSLSQLFDSHPDDASEPLRGGGMPPMLEHPDMVQTELPVGFHDDFEESWSSEEDFDATGSEPTADRSRLIWPGVSALLLLVLLIQLGMLWQTPGSPVARWLGGSALPDGSVNPNEAIQIISRDLHRHPSLDDAVVISASLRNQADFTIPFPVIEVRFFDASQQVLGVRRVTPEEYLSEPDQGRRGLPSGLVMPLLLEFVVGTSEPAGFQMRFH